MNDLGLAVCCSALQITLIGIVALGLIGAAKQSPGAAAGVAALGLSLSGLLAVLAVCPLGDCWIWGAAATGADTAISRSAARAPTPETDDLATSVAPAGRSSPAWSPGGLLRSWRGANTALASSASGGRWPACVAALMLAGVAVGLLRLVVGLLGIDACRRQSRPTSDERVLGLVGQMERDMGLSHRVEVRECPALGSPATVGWRQPVILLPMDWRGWSEAELCAVLAHELAHVRRWDFALWVAARIMVALNFHHPVCHWLAGTLRLEQELAADALAARYAGGRSAYLRALARMGLRQAGRPSGWPGPAFLSRPGTLMRRITMLRARERPEKRASIVLGLLAAVVLIATAVAASALRAPVVRAEEDNRPVAAPVVARPGSVEVPPFDLSYLAPDAVGAMGFRPAVFFAQPGMAAMAKLANAEIARGLKELGVKGELGLRVEDVEQITGSMQLKTDTSRKEGQTMMLEALGLIRTVKEFDWHGCLTRLFPGAIEIQHAGQRYYKVPKGVMAPLAVRFGTLELCYIIPDARTTVFDTEPHIRRLLEKGKTPRSALAWAVDWERIDRGLLAVAISGRDKRWLHDRRKPEESVAPEFLVMCEHADSLAYGVRSTDHLTAEAFFRSSNDESAAAVEKALRDLLAGERHKVDAPSSTQAQKTSERVRADLVRNSKVERTGLLVRWHVALEGSFADTINAVAGGGMLP
jgi:beta-lactamase regulating signal transducer with metallopeptidase domain